MTMNLNDLILDINLADFEVSCIHIAPVLEKVIKEFEDRIKLAKL